MLIQISKRSEVTIQEQLGDQIVFLIAVLALWQLAIWVWQVPSYLLPGPIAVAVRLFSDPLLFGGCPLRCLGCLLPPRLQRLPCFRWRTALATPRWHSLPTG